MNPQKITLVEQIKQGLKERIVNGELRSGHPVQSTRDLIKDYGVSHTTAVAALRELKREGWIDAKVGSGSFVSQSPPVGSYKSLSVEEARPSYDQKYLALLYCPYSSYDEIFHAELRNFLEKVLERKGYQLKTVSSSDTSSLEAVAKDKSAIGVVYPFNSHIKPFTLDIPVVPYGLSPDFENSLCVCPDNFQGGFVAGNYLYEMGHRKIGYVTIKIEKPSNKNFNRKSYRQIHFIQRYNGLCESLNYSGTEAPDLFCWNVKSEDSRREVSDLLKRVKRRDADSPTALLVANKFMASEIYMLAIGMGLRIPEDLSILTFISRGSEQISVEIDTIDFSREEMAEQLVNLVLNMPGNPICATPKVLLPMKLKECDSVKKLIIQ